MRCCVFYNATENGASDIMLSAWLRACMAEHHRCFTTMQAVNRRVALVTQILCPVHTARSDAVRQN